MRWIEILQVAWQVAVVLTPVVLGCIFLWLKTQFQSKADAAAEALRVSRLERDHSAMAERIGSLERLSDDPPTRSSLSKDVGKVAERVRGLETGLSAVQKALGTANNYLQTLIEQGLRK